jgi:L-threonylcarbamoyladenylate synthase
LKKRQNDSARTANIIPIDPRGFLSETIERAADCIRQDGVVIFPTSGLYGIGAHALSETAVRRVYAVKSRPAHKPLLVLLPTIEALDKVVQSVPGYARALMRLWPGGVTLIFEAADTLPAALTGGTGKIGVRLPVHPVARALTRRFGGPITGTSANVSGMPAPHRVMDIDAALSRQVDMVLDAGTLGGGPGSTIVDVSCWPVRTIREGAVGREAITEALRSC